MLIVFTTTPNIEEAESLARKIVEARLAACVQVLPQMKSFYFWENEIQSDAEHLLLIKTLEEKFDELEKFIKAQSQLRRAGNRRRFIGKSFGRLFKLDERIFTPKNLIL